MILSVILEYLQIRSVALHNSVRICHVKVYRGIPRMLSREQQRGKGQVMCKEYSQTSDGKQETSQAFCQMTFYKNLVFFFYWVQSHVHKVPFKCLTHFIQAKQTPTACTAKLKHLLKEDITERIEASERVSSILIFGKPDKSIRRCVDLQGPNQAIVIESYSLPHTEKLTNSLQGATYFSKLDLASA